MSELPEQWAFLPTGWKVAFIFTGCRAGATRIFQETIEELLRHPGAGNPHRARLLFFAALRRRALRYPAVCELEGLTAVLHRMAEPARSAFTLAFLKAVNEDELEHVLELGARQVAEEEARAHALLVTADADLGDSGDSLNEKVLAAFEAISPDEDAAKQIMDAAHALSARHGGHRISARNPATLAVGLGFLLLIAVLTWHFLGEAGLFPEEAVKIANAGAAARPDQFDPVDNDASQLRDWFMLKGFDDFQLPPGLGRYHVVGVRLFKFENEAIAQAAIAENTMFFYAFAGHSLGIDVVPEKTWRITQTDRWVLAIRQEKDFCFMIAFRGTKADMERLLEKTTAQ